MVVNVPTTDHNTGRWLPTAIRFAGRTPSSPGRNHMTSPNAPVGGSLSTHPQLRQLADTGQLKGGERVDRIRHKLARRDTHASRY